jgi:ankyrin repeat protein
MVYYGEYLFWAVYDKNLPEAKKYLHMTDLDPNTVVQIKSPTNDTKYLTPLGIACRMGHVEMVRLILSHHQTDPNFSHELKSHIMSGELTDPNFSTQSSECTPLMIACGEYDWTVMMLKTDTEKKTEILNLQENLWEIINLLVNDSRIDINKKITYYVPMSAIEICIKIASCGTKHYKLIDLFLNHPDFKQSFEILSECNDLALFEYLLSNPKINPNFKDDHGLTFLHRTITNANAVYKDPSKYLPILLKHPSLDPNSQDKFHKTPLHEACVHADPYCAQQLLLHPLTNPNIADASGRSPIFTAAKFDRVQNLRMIWAHPKFKERRPWNDTDSDGIHYSVYAWWHGKYNALNFFLGIPQWFKVRWISGVCLYLRRKFSKY